MSKSRIVIQPTYELLRDIIGDEATLELRQCIVEQFAKHHLKAVAADENFRQVLETVSKDIKNYIELRVEQEVIQVKADNRYNRLIQLTTPLENRINREIQDRITSIVGELLDKAINARLETMDNYIEDLVNKEINKRLSAKVSAIIQNFMNKKKDEMNKSLTDAIEK